MDECSYCDVGVGPFGPCTTVPFAIHGEIKMAGTRTPNRSKVKLYGGGPTMPSGLGTPWTGVGTWSKKPPCSS
uniref:Uncharacterized protein n=1 Tax=Arundo donax TaxID=35708 RepID=A0A0A9G9P6_ARUDO